MSGFEQEARAVAEPFPSPPALRCQPGLPVEISRPRRDSVRMVGQPSTTFADRLPRDSVRMRRNTGLGLGLGFVCPDLKESGHKNHQILNFGGILHVNENALQLFSGNDPCLDECGRSFGHGPFHDPFVVSVRNGRLMDIHFRSGEARCQYQLIRGRSCILRLIQKLLKAGVSARQGHSQSTSH
jgi:hypothetical protein